MPSRGPDGRFVREEGLNINIGIFMILKYLIVLAAIFLWYKLIEKTEILKIFDTYCPACECSANECPIHEFFPCIFICLTNATGSFG